MKFYLVLNRIIFIVAVFFSTTQLHAEVTLPGPLVSTD